MEADEAVPTRVVGPLQRYLLHGRKLKARGGGSVLTQTGPETTPLINVAKRVFWDLDAAFLKRL
eukprot:8188098-Lingulodinium_polyedra.AAC.1